MVQLFLIRHGTTEAVEKHLMQGSTDSPLSVRGQEEARRTSEALKEIRFKTAFSSPMIRALETAMIITKPHPGLEITRLDALHEINFGYYEGKPYFASPDEVPHGLRWMILLIKVAIAQFTGESLTSISKRAMKSWEQISDGIPVGQILIVSHGVLLNYLLKYLLPATVFKTIQPVSLNPCSISELKVIGPGNVKIIRINDTAHLR